MAGLYLISESFGCYLISESFGCYLISESLGCCDKLGHSLHQKSSFRLWQNGKNNEFPGWSLSAVKEPPLPRPCPASPGSRGPRPPCLPPPGSPQPPPAPCPPPGTQGTFLEGGGRGQTNTTVSNGGNMNSGQTARGQGSPGGEGSGPCLVNSWLAVGLNYSVTGLAGGSVQWSIVELV